MLLTNFFVFERETVYDFYLTALTIEIIPKYEIIERSLFIKRFEFSSIKDFSLFFQLKI